MIQNYFKHCFWMARAHALRLGSKHDAYCAICEQAAPAFLPYRGGSASLSDILRDLALVGSDLDRFRCPRCGSTDRERHLLQYIARVPQIQFDDQRILHFAPEPFVRRLIKEQVPLEYVQADLFPTAPEICRVDITHIPFVDGYFDVVIANHVLEHVANDSDALGEIARVLKVDGLAILQTPYAAALAHTIDIPQITSSKARLQLYGQEDHVRLYGADVFERIQSMGFKSMVKSHHEILAEIDPELYGVNVLEPLFLFQRQA